MFGFSLISKTIVHHRTVNPKAINSRFFHSTSYTSHSESLVVSYLQNSCGLPLEAAIIASKKVNIVSTVKPAEVINFFRAHGFKEIHISKLISKDPKLLVSDVEKTLKPKLEYFESIGIVGPDLHKFLCSNKNVLRSSLKNQITPLCDFVKGLTNGDLAHAFQQSSYLFNCSFTKVVVPNLETLGDHGIPESHIEKVMFSYPRCLLVKNVVFKEIVSMVRDMGFDPQSTHFIHAVRSMSVMSKVTWKRKKELLISLGWSENDFLSAFRRQPMFMLTSEQKLARIMEFLVNKLGLEPSSICEYTNLFVVSLEKTTMPRYAVLQVLISKGLMEKDLNLLCVLNTTRKHFERKYLAPLKKYAPELVKVYRGEMEL